MIQLQNAKAKRSKVSNERIPENMEVDLQRTQQKNKENKGKEKHDKIRLENYHNFLKQVPEAKTERPNFSDDENVKNKVDSLLARKATHVEIEKPLELIQNDLNEDAPIEVSAKIQRPKIIVPKKEKKKVLKIKSVHIAQIETNKDHQITEDVKEFKITNEKNYNSLLESDDLQQQNLTKSQINRLEKRKRQLKAKQREMNGDSDSMQFKSSSNKEQNSRKSKFPTEKYEKSDKDLRKVAKLKYDEEEISNPKQKAINGVEMDVVQFGDLRMRKEDAYRLTELKKQMISKGIKHREIKRTLDLEAVKVTKRLAKKKRIICYQCHKSGHILSDCPELNTQQISFGNTGICFKCGSIEHTQLECRVANSEALKFASCFICKKQGHISRKCPDLANGLYPRSLGCRLCGDATHLKKACPQNIKEKQEHLLFLKVLSGENLETLGEGLNNL